MNKNKVKKISKALMDIISEDKIILDADILEKYSRDETSDVSFKPDIVVRADSVKDVSKIMKICSQYRMPVIPRGAGTGVTGGAIPVQGGLILSLEKMNNILEIDKENMIAVVEPGVITGNLQDAVLEHGLMYPPDPASLDSCSIGGNVSEGAGGPKAVKYGTTKDYITGLEFVLPNGDIINTGGKIVKNATGYNLAGIVIGSEGTLAVITKIYLKLIPAPANVIDLLIPFDSLEDALNVVPVLMLNKIVPSTIEFMERDAIQLVQEFIHEDNSWKDAGAHLLIQIDGSSEEMVMNDLHKLSNIIKTKYEIMVAESKSQKDRIWKIRRSIREAIESTSSVFLAEDTVVPRAKIPEFVKDVKDYLNSQNFQSAIFGHAGDGNVHIDVLKGDMDYAEWQKILPVIKKNIYERAIRYGGMITGEHGIGLIKKDYLGIALSKESIELSKRIKAAFDPDMILNPGKIF
ncbi:MAG: FAD-binding protein [Spirochaetes bacterium]|nr:FAD-binding protein [Spirochaetota bacterium]